MTLTPILYIIGLLLGALSTTLLIPLGYDYAYGDPNWKAFATSFVLSSTCALMMVIATKPKNSIELSVRQAFLLTSLAWIILSTAAALPFVFSNSTNTHTDSFFEAISALTTTGATILTGIEYTSRGIVVWRSILQWLGGIGIIVMALTVLPILRIGGMQLFRSEFSDRSEKILPRISHVAGAICLTYVVSTLICILSLWFANMTFLDAFCHALAIVSTGGFSTTDESIMFFNSPLIELITIFFMIVGGSTILLFVRALRGDPTVFWKDMQFRTYIFLILSISIGLTLWRWNHANLDFLTTLRETTFSVVSIMTTSGFVSADYGLWGTFPIMIIFVLMFMGSCTGSTSGGIKIFRFLIVFILARTQLKQLRHPHGVFVPTYNDKQITHGVFDSVFTYFALFCFSLLALTLGLSMYGLDFVTSLSGSVAALCNIGPGHGHIIGPTGNYASLPDGAKWLLMTGMLLGRLEFVTIAILFSGAFWRR